MPNTLSLSPELGQSLLHDPFEKALLGDVRVVVLELFQTGEQLGPQPHRHLGSLLCHLVLLYRCNVTQPARAVKKKLDGECRHVPA